MKNKCIAIFLCAFMSFSAQATDMVSLFFGWDYFANRALPTADAPRKAYQVCENIRYRRMATDDYVYDCSRRDYMYLHVYYNQPTNPKHQVEIKQEHNNIGHVTISGLMAKSLFDLMKIEAFFDEPTRGVKKSIANVTCIENETKTLYSCQIKNVVFVNYVGIQ